jgi:hypothetical protein
MNMLTPFRVNPPVEGDTIEVPKLGTATPLSGTGAFVVTFTLDMLRSPEQLSEIIVALEEQGAEEDMVSAWPKDTGLDNAIKIIPGNPRHGPRIKVAIDPPDRFADTGLSATIPFGTDSISDPIPQNVVPAKVAQQLRQFIELNREVLLRVDRSPEEGGISGVALGSVLQKISR